MDTLALGLIETVGLVTAIEAADAMAKSANVKVLGYELTKGGGLVTIKIVGDVGAVRAALDAGKAASEKVTSVYASHIIPRPSDEVYKKIIEPIIKKNEALEKNEETSTEIKEEDESQNNDEKEGQSEEETPKEESSDELGSEEISNNEDEKTENLNIEEKVEKVDESEEDKKLDIIEEGESSIVEQKLVATCNICNDPQCKRKKGDPRSLCIHFND